MARKKVIDLNADTTISFEKPGQKLEGYYIGFKNVQTSFGPSKLHVFQTDAGSVGAWGSAQLDAKLSTVERGCMTYVTFVKKTKVPKGTLKNFEVEYDDELKMDVADTAVNFSNEPSEEEEGEELEAADESEEPADVDPEEPAIDEEEEQEAPPVRHTAAPKKGAPAGITPEQKAKAQAMLNKARSAAKAS